MVPILSIDTQSVIFALGTIPKERILGIFDIRSKGLILELVSRRSLVTFKTKGSLPLNYTLIVLMQTDS